MPAVADGIEQAQIVLAEQTLYRPRPDVSIDGKRFIYASTRGSADQYNNLYVQPTKPGGEPYKLTFFEHDAFHPRWSPDGEWIAYITNGSANGLPQLALLETYGGEQRTVTIGPRRWKRPMGALAVRVHGRGHEGANRRPRPPRRRPTAKLYAPRDAYARVSGAGDRMFHTPGTFRVELPAGKVTMDVVKGFEFIPAKVEATVSAGPSTTNLTCHAAAAHGHVSVRVVQRIDARAHELRRQPPQHAREPDDDVRRGRSGHRQRAGRQQGQPHSRLSALRARAAARIRSRRPTASSSSARNIGRRSTVTCSCFS